MKKGPWSVPKDPPTFNRLPLPFLTILISTYKHRRNFDSTINTLYIFNNTNNKKRIKTTKKTKTKQTQKTIQ